jgi:hypothetical protein
LGKRPKRKFRGAKPTSRLRVAHLRNRDLGHGSIGNQFWLLSPSVAFSTFSVRTSARPGDWVQCVPVFGTLSILNSVEGVIRRGALSEAALAYNQNEITLPQHSVNPFVLYCQTHARPRGLHGMVSFVPSALHCPFSVNQMSAERAQCLNILLRMSGQNSFATLKKVSRAICCPHLSAVFANDRFTAG